MVQCFWTNTSGVSGEELAGREEGRPPDHRKFEKVALRWFERYLSEGTPRRDRLAEVAANLAELEDTKALP